MHTVTLIPGDGVGPEVVEVARRVVEATRVPIRWEVHDAGERALKSKGTPVPDDLLNSIKKNEVALKGPVTTPVGTGFRSANVTIRNFFDLYINLRPAKTFPGIKTLYPQVDLVVIRENKEDLYIGIEFEQGSKGMNGLRQFLSQNEIEISDDAACSFKVISWEESVRIVRFAFEYAACHHRKKVTAVHKANILKATDGLFLKAANTIAKDFPEIQFEEINISNLCMQLVHNPELYDVLVLPNLYGDIVSDLCAGLTGGLGLAPSANLGEHAAVFEPVHGSAPKYEGQNKVNPIAGILSAALMLRHLDEQAAADAIEEAVGQVLVEGKLVTNDLKNFAEASLVVGTQEVADNVIARLRNLVGISSPGRMRT